MPPRSYIITATILVVSVFISFPLTMGFSILLWYWLFAAAACVLAVAGAFKVTDGLGAPRWIAIALASPGIVWAVKTLYEMPFLPSPATAITFYVAAFLALLAAGGGALRLIEVISGPHAAFRVAYGILAAAALLMVVGLVARAMGWSFTTSASYVFTSRTLSYSAAVVKYGAFIGAAMLITLRRDIERWTGIAISLVSAFMLYRALRPLFVVDHFGSGEGLMFLQPAMMLVGGAAVWRMGSLLRSPSTPKRPLPSEGPPAHAAVGTTT
jgi:hypothetical protein